MSRPDTLDCVFLSRAKFGAVGSNPRLSPSEVSDVLRNSAVDLGAPGTDNTFGSGRIDAFAAVESVVEAPPTPTPTPTPSPSPTPTPSPTPPPPGGGASTSGSSGGCAVGGPVQLGSALANILIPLIPALPVGVRMIRRRKKNTLASKSHVKA